MKMLTFILALGTAAAAHAGKLDRATDYVDKIRLPDPPRVSTETTRTPERAAQEYRDSGNKPGPQTIKTKPVPAP